MARKQFTTEQALAAVLASSVEEDGGGVSEPEGFNSGDEDTYEARKDPFEDATIICAAQRGLVSSAKKVVVARDTVPLQNVTLKQGDTRVPLFVEGGSPPPVRVSHLRGSMSDYEFQLQSTLNSTVEVLSSTSVEVVGAYGVMDVEGSPGELEVLPDDNRTLNITQEKWDPITAKMKAPPPRRQRSPPGNLLVVLDAEVIPVVGVTFTELCAPTGDVMNPDTRAFDVTILLPLVIGFIVTGNVVEADDWEMAIKLGKFVGLVVLGLYWPVAFLEALMTTEGGSHLKQGSRSAIFMAMMEDRRALFRGSQSWCEGPGKSDTEAFGFPLDIKHGFRHVSGRVGLPSSFTEVHLWCALVSSVPLRLLWSNCEMSLTRSDLYIAGSLPPPTLQVECLECPTDR
ncbi:hypothetical protein EYF80_012334 [Liparis tanakae]|uniref:Uncharacterized protein n=1 Tax=Liparis tanakae TaxID=230148 RepID=A0A4Z2IHR5_9TELE|nr:hypothetical protein EYF80_012334 [Liparis tanakae]